MRFLIVPFSGPQRLPSCLGSPSHSEVPGKGSMGASSPIPGPCLAAVAVVGPFSCLPCPLQQHWTQRLGPCPDSWALVPLIALLDLPPFPSPAVSVPDPQIHHRRCLQSTAPLWQPSAWLLPEWNCGLQTPPVVDLGVRDRNSRGGEGGEAKERDQGDKGPNNRARGRAHV